MHNMTFVTEADTSVLFSCVDCGAQISVMKEGYGTPNPTHDGSTWNPPTDINNYLDPCPGV